MAKLVSYMNASFRSGVLVATGGVAPTATGGLRATLGHGKFNVENGPLRSKLQQSAGWAILNVSSRDHLIEEIRTFLELAGDGESEMIEITEAPRPEN
jgi:hypothetical protein